MRCVTQRQFSDHVPHLIVGDLQSLSMHGIETANALYLLEPRMHVLLLVGHLFLV